MALYNVTLFKRLIDLDQEGQWTNVYHVDAASPEDALDHAESIIQVERLVHWDIVEYFRVSAKQPGSEAPAGQARSVTDVGARDSAGENFIPLYCTARVVLDDLAARPDQKYLRLPIMESEQGAGFLEASTVDLINTAYVGGLLGLTFLRSSSNSTYIGGTTELAVQMRQRGWKRRSREGFKRGWVPV